MLIEIKDIFGKVLHSLDCENNTIKITVEDAVKNKTNLSDADLSDADLSGTNLSRANLSGTNLSRAYLSRANLSGTNLSGAYLSRAYLSRANLLDADLSGADLSGTNLSRANLSDADLSDADLSGTNLSGAYLSGAYLSDADLSDADLSDADLSRANLSRAKHNNKLILAIKQFGCFGSINRNTIAFYLTDEIIINCGCFKGSLQEFKEQITKTHNDNIYAKEYLLLCDFIEKDYELIKTHCERSGKKCED